MRAENSVLAPSVLLVTILSSLTFMVSTVLRLTTAAVSVPMQNIYKEAFPRVHQWPEHGYVICLRTFLPADAGCAPERGAKGV